MQNCIIKIGWPSGNAFIFGAGGLRFKSRAGQIGHSDAMTRHRCDISPKVRSCFARAHISLDKIANFETHYTLWRNTMSTMKDLI